MTPQLIEGPHLWTLSLNSAVTQCRFDHAFTMMLGDIASETVEIRIEQSFVIIRSSERIALNPELDPVLMAPALGVLGLPVSQTVAYKNGALEVQFANGTILTVAPSEEYEAWTMLGPDQLRIVSMPGGELAMWTSKIQ